MRIAISWMFAFLGPTLTAQVVVNEVDYDQPGIDDAEFVEILNNGSTPFDMVNLNISFVDGSDGEPMQYLSFGSSSWPILQPGERYTLCLNNLTVGSCDETIVLEPDQFRNGAPSSVILIDVQPTMAVIMDALSYGGTVPGYSEGSGTMEADDEVFSERSIGRWPDGNDTGSNESDVRQLCSTPGSANSLFGELCDLTVGTMDSRVPQSFYIVPSPIGNDLLFHFKGIGGAPVVIDVFSAAGIQLSNTIIPQGLSSWSMSVSRWSGQLLMIRMRTSSIQYTNRIFVP